MEFSDLSMDEWLELYRYLLQGIESRGYSDLRGEIEAAASAPIVEVGTEEEETRIQEEFRSEVGRLTLRHRNSFEVFSAALDVIWTRLVELPEVASALASSLGNGRRQIEFRVDYEERYALRQSQPVPIHRLLLDEVDKRKIRDVLHDLGVSPERLNK
jgi:hypothetical protein